MAFTGRDCVFKLQFENKPKEPMGVDKAPFPEVSMLEVNMKTIDLRRMARPRQKIDLRGGKGKQYQCSSPFGSGCKYPPPFSFLGPGSEGSSSYPNPELREVVSYDPKEHLCKRCGDYCLAKGGRGKAEGKNETYPKEIQTKMEEWRPVTDYGTRRTPPSQRMSGSLHVDSVVYFPGQIPREE